MPTTCTQTHQQCYTKLVFFRKQEGFHPLLEFIEETKCTKCYKPHLGDKKRVEKDKKYYT